MIAADTSVLIDYFKGINNPYTEKLDEVFNYHSLVLPLITCDSDFRHFVKYCGLVIF